MAGLTIRGGTAEDAEDCGRICYAAFKTISEQHNFPPDIPTPEAWIGVLTMMLSHPGFYSAVGEQDGRIVGSNFLDERSPVGGIGPITIDPECQSRGAGRELMINIIDRGQEQGMPGIRLLQDCYHNRSFALYAKLGFKPREVCAVVQGPAIEGEVPGRVVRKANEEDVAECNRICIQVHGHHRGGELMDSVRQGTARVVECHGTITGYASSLGFLGHSVGAGNDDVKALILASSEFQGPGFFLPITNHDLLNWALANSLRVVKLMTLMTMGLYNQPQGAYLPSVLY